MKVSVEKKISIFFECLTLLNRYYNGDTFEKWKDDHIKRYAKSNPLLLKSLDKLIELQNHVIKHITANQERLEFFFKYRGNNNYCYASLLCSVINIPPYQLDDFIKNVKCPSHDQLRYKFADFITEGYSYEFETPTKIDSDNTLIKLIDDTVENPQEKWDLLILYQNYNSYLHEIIKIVQPLMPYCEEKIELFRPEIDSYYDQYTEIIDNNPIAYIERNLQITFTENKDLLIFPWITGFNMGTASCDDQSESSPNNLYVGILFTQIGEVAHNSISTERICQRLKVLGDQSKFEILKAISNKSAYGQELATMLGLTTATISHHMSALIECGFIKIKPDANRLYYSMDKETIEWFLNQLKQGLLE